MRLSAFILLMLLSAPGLAGGVVLQAVALETTATGSRLHLQLSGETRLHLKTLSQPHRLIIDLENTDPADHDLAANLSGNGVRGVGVTPRPGGETRIIVGLDASINARLADDIVTNNGARQISIDLPDVAALTRRLEQLPATAAGLPVLALNSPPAYPVRSSPGSYRQPSPASESSDTGTAMNHAGKELASAGYDLSPVALEVVHDGATIAYIEALEYIGGFMLSLDALFQVLGYEINIDADSGTADGWFREPGNIFVVNARRGTAIISGKETSFDQALVQSSGLEMYADSGLLSTLLGLDISIDPAMLSLQLRAPDGAALLTRLGQAKRWVAQKDHQHEARRPEQDAPDHVPAAPPPSSPQAPPLSARNSRDILQDDNLLVLQPVISDSFTGDFLECFQSNGHYYLPLSALSLLLDFPIEVDIAAGRASGWFIHEDNTFVLDMNRAEVMLAGKSESLAIGTAYRNDWDIFIDSESIARWFSLQLAFDTHELTVSIGSEEPLVFEARAERQKNWEALRREKLKPHKNYPVVSTPYQLATRPFMDVNIGTAISQGNASKAVTSYSVSAGGDLGYLNTRVLAGGSSDGDSLGTLRLTAGRSSHNGGLLGILNANRFSTGDINSITIPMTIQAGQGRGVMVSNRALIRPSAFDATDFVGDSLPGWEVELYHNGTLIGFDTVGDDGRYEFLEAPILFGNNTFRLVFHGPQGQYHEEVRRFLIEESLLPRGDMNYEFTVNEKNATLFGIGEQSAESAGGLRYGGEIEYGLTDQVSLSLGAASTPLNDGRQHDYLSGGVKASIGRVFTSIDSAYDLTDQRWAATLSALTRIFNLDIKAEHRILNGFISEAIPNATGSITRLGLNLSVGLPVLGNLNLSQSISREVSEAGIASLNIRSRTSKSLYGMHFTNELNYARGGGTSSATGELSLQRYLYGVSLRGVLGYTVRPVADLRVFNILAQKRLTENMLGRVGVTQNLDESGATLLNGSLNWDRKTYKLSLQMNMDDSGELFFGANILFALANDARNGQWRMQSREISHSGAVLARAYLDRNFNARFDGDDEYIENARFKLHQQSLDSDAGVGFALGMEPEQLSQVVLDPLSLNDPLWISQPEGFSFVARAGVVQVVEFPVLETSEVDGSVYLVEDDGSRTALPRVPVELVSEDGSSDDGYFATEFDGFFLFEKVLPGSYEVQVRQAYLKRHGLTQPTPAHVVVDQGSNIYSGYDLELQRTDQILPKANTQSAEPVR